MIFTQKGLIRQSGSHLVMEYDFLKNPNFSVPDENIREESHNAVGSSLMSVCRR